MFSALSDGTDDEVRSEIMSVMPRIILGHVTGRAAGDDGGTAKSNLPPPNKFLGGVDLVGGGTRAVYQGTNGKNSTHRSGMFEEMR